jgi:hypothetical protein
LKCHAGIFQSGINLIWFWQSSGLFQRVLLYLFLMW